MEKKLEVVEIPVIAVIDSKTGEMHNIVYRNEKLKSNVVCNVSISGWEDFKTLFNSLIGVK